MIVNLVPLFPPDNHSDIDKIFQFSLDCSAAHADGSFYFPEVERFLVMAEEERKHRRSDFSEQC